MRRTLVTGIMITAATFLGAISVSSTARAGIGACGNIDVEASAKCKVEVEGGCEAKCEPVNFTAACAGKLYVDCENSKCDLELPECNISCEASCSGECNVNPGEFECEGKCEGKCEGNCDGQCAASDDKAHCQAACKATCSGECSGSCSGTPPSATCEAKCQASCDGQCRGEANLSCQIECQAEGEIDCEAELQGGCEVACKQPEGALFCDGQYVDHGDNLKECIAALDAMLEIKVDGSASGECDGNSCTGEAEGSVSCAVTPSAGNRGWGWGVLAVGLAAGAVARRRRR